MKHLLLAILLLSGTASEAQPPVSELIKSDIGYTYRTVPSNQKRGVSDTIEVQVAPELIEKFQLKNIDLFKMSLVASRKASGSLKEGSSYKLGSKFNIFLVNNEIKYSWEYYGQNAYGAEKKNTMVLTFDVKGAYKTSVIL